MSTQYHVVDKDHYKNNIVIDSAVLVEDGVVWDEGEVQMSLCYTSNDATLTENNNENYLSTAEDDENETQYFSILETTNETTLNDLNDITLYTNGYDNVEISEHQETNTICALEPQQNIYAIGGSEDLYAFQVAYDEEGNMQRYRYILRLNENGDYETVPESLELVSPDEEIELAESQIAPSEVPESEVENNTRIPLRTNELIVKKEEYAQDRNEETENVRNVNEDSYDELHVNEDEENEFFEETHAFKRNVDNKTGILEQNLLSVQKMEATNYDSEESNTPSVYDQENFIQVNDNASQDKSDTSEPPSHNSPIQTEELGLRSFEQVYTLQSEVTNDNEEADASDDALEDEQLIITDQSELRDTDDEDDEDPSKSPNSNFSEDHCEGNENVEFVEAINDNESDAEEFQIVDGVHVTADTDGNEEIIHAMETLGEKNHEQLVKLQNNFPVLQSTANDLKVRNSINKNGKKVNKHLMYYVVKNPEKENVATISQSLVNNKIIKANPRSVLKSSFSFFEQKKENENHQTQVGKTEKKPIKNKENHARILHNFIAKTTIIHAPVRQERLPRKQTIKPVERADEEIIVQEVVVSSNGFIETSEDGVVKSKIPLKPTQFVQVTDSDEDYNSKREQKKKKKKKKRKSKITEIVISDTEDEISDDNIVQIDLSAESDHETQNENNLLLSDKNIKKTDGLLESSTDLSTNDIAKRKRGRPRKRQHSGLDETSTADSSSSKKRKSTTNDSESSDLPTPSKPEFHNIRTKWKCNTCPKVFPSQGSLKTHMQYHTYHEPNIKKSLFKRPVRPNNHKCAICHETFKNNYLLTKHTKEHDDANKFECGICKKLFSDRLQLTNHKRSHVKEQMFKSTTLPKNSPKNKKSLGTKINKISPTKENHKCLFCSKVFTSLAFLNAHLRTHKRFTCLTCTATFISKLALEDHVQRNCVRKLNSPTRRLSLKTKTRKSFVTHVNKSKRVSLRSSGKGRDNTNTSSEADKGQKTASAAKPIALKCDSCLMVFKSHTNLFRHKVIKHGLETPDKNIKNKKLLLKDVHRHGSVPIGEKIINALANLRTLK